jgi:hypothetical protein
MLNTRKIKRKSSALESAAYPFEVHRPATPGQRILLEKYPRFFRAVASPAIYQCALAHWGIECGKGWYPLIDEAAAKIEAELKKLLDDFCSGRHLSWIDRRLQNIGGNSNLGHHDSDEEYPLIPFCAEVKEKAGTLRILTSPGHLCGAGAWVRIRNAIEDAERKSETTCERCGLPGMMRNYSWDHVYCESCASGN